MLKYFFCSGWHGAGSANWFGDTGGGFRRGRSGMFSFDGGTWTVVNYYGRGVAVVGIGL